jgi:hypothetical protein
MARWTIGEQTIVMMSGDEGGMRLIFSNNPANAAEARLRIEDANLENGAFELTFTTGGPLVMQRWRDGMLAPWSQDEDHSLLDQQEAAIDARLDPASAEEKRKAALEAQANAEKEAIAKRREMADLAQQSNERTQSLTITSSASVFAGGGVARPNEAAPTDINPNAAQTSALGAPLPENPMPAPAPVTPDRMADVQTSPAEPVFTGPAAGSQSATSGVETLSVVGTPGNAPTEAALTGGDTAPQAVDTHADLPGTGPGTHSVGDTGVHPAAEAAAAQTTPGAATDAGVDHSNDQNRGSVNARGALPTGDAATEAGNAASPTGGAKKRNAPAT